MNWLIGANSSCDLIVDAPGVSSRHCELASVGGDLQITDLNSTNGTWINGQRITIPTIIRSGDSIRLGMQTPVTWERIEKLSQCRVIRIGRNVDNDVVIADEKVSGQHARLLVDGSDITLIDLESGNGTAVGAPGNKTTRTTVAPADEVYFASSRFRVSQLMDAASTASSSTHSNAWYRRSVVWMAAATVAALVMLGLMFRGNQKVVVSPSDTKISVVTADPEPIPNTPVEKETSAEKRLQHALFAVVVKSEESEPGLRIGTAWAVTDRQLATSGNLVLFIQQSKDEFPVVVVQGVLDGREVPVADSTVHSVCRQNAERMRELEEQIDRLRINFEELTNPLGDDTTLTTSPTETSANETAANETATAGTAKNLTEQILQLEDQWFVAAEEMIHFDIGLMMTDTSILNDALSTPLRIAEENPARLAAVTVSGVAFAHDQSIITDQSELPVTHLPGTIESFVRRKGDVVPRTVLRCSSEHMKQNWMGAPVLNSAGSVIGVYSRPTPSQDPDVPPTGDHCDIVSVARLHELLTGPE